MYTPTTFAAAMTLMVVCMFCWGSWPNLLKMLHGWRLEFFYLDYTWGFVIAAVVCAATLGSANSFSAEFWDRLRSAPGELALCGVIGGLFWNLGNIFLLNSIVIAGLSVAFPIAAAPALTLGVVFSYLAQPVGRPIWLTTGVVLLLGAAIANAAAYRRLRESVTAAGARRGVVLAVIAGVSLAFFPPFVAHAISGPDALDSYTVSIYFTLGAMLASVLIIPVLVRRPLAGTAGNLRDYFEAHPKLHGPGLLAGGVWLMGTVFNFLSASIVGMAITVGIGSGGAMVGALWGVLVWREFHNAGPAARWLIASSLSLYLAGVIVMAAAYRV